LDKKKLLVVGGTGFIGSHLVTEGLRRKFEVFSFSTGLKNAPKKDIQYIYGNIQNEESIKSIFHKNQYHYIIYSGGYINHSSQRSEGMSVIQEHFIPLMYLYKYIDPAVLQKFLYLGSSDEYGSLPAPQSEDLRENPISSYSFAKSSSAHFLQMLFKTENFPSSIARLFLTYGPGQDEKRFLPQIIQGCLKNSEFPTSLGEQYRDFCYISDIVEGCFQILERKEASGEIFNLGTGEKIKIRDLIQKIVDIIGRGKPLFGKIPYRNGENMALYPNISKAQKILNWKPKVSLTEGLEKTILFYKNHVDSNRL
jgi:nucleoside-diphosphate-sugar epimerase